MTKTIVGSPIYMAPEILDQEKCQKGYNAKQADIFALGIIIFSMFIGRPPFHEANPSKDRFYNLIYQMNYTEFW